MIVYKDGQSGQGSFLAVGCGEKKKSSFLIKDGAKRVSKQDDIV